MTKAPFTSARMMGVALADIILLHATMIICFAIRYAQKIPSYNFDTYTKNVIPLSLLFVFCLFICDLYETRRTAWTVVVENVLKATGLFSLCIVFLVFMSRDFAFPRSIVLISFVGMNLTLLGWRRLVWSTLLVPSKSDLMVIATSREFEQNIHKLSEDRQCVFNIKAGLVIGDKSQLEHAGFPVFEASDDMNLSSLIDTLRIDAIMLTPNTPSDIKHSVAMIAMRRGYKLIVVPDLYETLISTSSMSSINDMPILQIKEFTASTRDLAIKRILDIAISLAALVVTLPISVFVALGIKLTSKGPVLYSQERVGLSGRHFRIFKFRTMVPDAERLTGPVLASKDDARITPFGKLLRKTRIDELPQLINVLMGQMSIVGPRPERPCFVEQFASSIPGYDLRHRVPVGITGLAQVLGSYDTHPGDKLTYDVAYASSWSISRDVKIMLRTASIMLERKGAR